MTLIDKVEIFFINLSLLKKVILFAFILVLVVLFGSFVLVSSSKQKTQSIPQTVTLKTWEITITYNTQSKTFSSKKVNLINRKITQDFRSAEFSPYELDILDSNGEKLYATKINISRELIFDISNESASSGASFPTQPVKLDSIFYIPYFKNGVKIIIKESSKTVLEIPLPQQMSFDFFKIEQASAQTMPAAQSCSPLTVVFISDNYQNFNDYHRDVDIFKQVYTTTQPFASNPNIFDFKVIDNSQALGCQNGILNCIQNPMIKQIVTQNYSNFSKIVVIANAPRANPNDGGALGVTNAVGGDLAVFPNNYGNITNETRIVAGHEFLGHAVGLLYDRYVSSDPSYGGIQNGIKSNCTDNSAGESWWPQAGSTTPYKGCGNMSSYAPFPATCGSKNPALITAGTPTSMMSAVGCGGNQFDPVEQYWIKNNILSKYSGCSTSPQTSPSPSVSVTPVIPPNTKLPTIKGTVYIDKNSNQQPDQGEGYQGGIISIAGASSASTTSDANGNFSFESIPTGTYTISAKIGSAVFDPSKEFSVTSRSIYTADFGVPPQAVSSGQTPGSGGSIASGSGGVTSGGAGNSSNVNPFGQGQTPASKTYITGTCVFDNSCLQNTSSVQICSLKCKAN